MNLRAVRLLLLSAALAAVMAACGGGTAEPLPTYTPYPTYTPVPIPTATPILHVRTDMVAALRKVFYYEIDDIPDIGRPDVRSILPDVFVTTETLFWLWDPGAFSHYKRAHITGDYAIVERRFKGFLNQYLRSLNEYRRGYDYCNRTRDLAGLLKSIQNVNFRLSMLPEDIREDAEWASVIFGGRDNYTKTHLRRLSETTQTQGSRDWYASGIHNSMTERADFMVSIGGSEIDVFLGYHLDKPCDQF